MELPIKIVVYVLITAAIAAVAVVGFSHVEPAVTSNIMEKQIGAIGASLNIMQHGAARNLIEPASADGNMRTFEITIPEGVEYLAFGADPENKENLTNIEGVPVTEKGSVIFYRSRTGGKVRVPLDASIELREGLREDGRWVVNNANGRQQGVVITGNGKFKLTFELVYDPISKETYTLSHYTDDMDAYINPLLTPE